MRNRFFVDAQKRQKGDAFPLIESSTRDDAKPRLVGWIIDRNEADSIVAFLNHKAANPDFIDFDIPF